MKDEVLELVTQQLTEIRLHDIVHADQEYTQAEQKETERYEHFLESLTECQREEFENFLVAVNESAFISEKLSYQQGMKDLLSLLRSLGNDRG